MIFDRYIFKNLLIATILIALVLIAIIFLTQSLRFLELVINAGASGAVFWILTLLALPRFFEIVLPVALMIATVFVYNRMTMDSEMVVMRATGSPPMRLARPAIILSLLTAVFLLLMTSWLAPLSLSGMQHMRDAVRTQYSNMLLREGVFNAIGSGFTVYIRERTANGELHGLMIHDHRAQNRTPVTITAKRGLIVDQKVMVFDGSRQELNPETGVLQKLSFDRYMVDLPESTGAVRQRWREPDERALWELFTPDPDSVRDQESRREFFVEINRRLISPFFAPAFTLLALALLLLGPVDRRGQGWRIAMAVIMVLLIQGGYLSAFNIARSSNWGLVVMYLLVIVPIVISGWLLHERSESFRRRVFYAARRDNRAGRKAGGAV